MSFTMIRRSRSIRFTAKTDPKTHPVQRMDLLSRMIGCGRRRSSHVGYRAGQKAHGARERDAIHIDCGGFVERVVLLSN